MVSFVFLGAYDPPKHCWSSSIDYQNLTAFPCKKCGEKITTSSGVTEVLKVGEDRYHPRCFCCTTCETPFINNKANQHQGKFYCDTHFTLAKAGKTSLMQ